MHLKDDWAEHCVDRICRLGCRRVSDIIHRLEQGERVAEVAGLSPGERRAVLAELQSIMAVYGGSCRAEAATR